MKKAIFNNTTVELSLLQYIKKVCSGTRLKKSPNHIQVKCAWIYSDIFCTFMKKIIIWWLENNLLKNGNSTQRLTLTFQRQVFRQCIMLTEEKDTVLILLKFWEFKSFTTWFTFSLGCLPFTFSYYGEYAFNYSKNKKIIFTSLKQ